MPLHRNNGQVKFVQSALVQCVETVIPRRDIISQYWPSALWMEDALFGWLVFCAFFQDFLLKILALQSLRTWSTYCELPSISLSIVKVCFTVSGMRVWS